MSFLDAEQWVIAGSYLQPFSFNSVSLSGKDFILVFLPVIPFEIGSNRIKPDRNRRKVLDWKICFSLDQQVLAFGTFTLPKPKMAQLTKQNQNKMITYDHELVQRSFWPYSPAILQVKVFYSSSIILENRIAYELCQKYVERSFNDVRSFTRSIRSFSKNIRSSFWWRSFTRGSYIFDQDHKLYLLIVHF